MFLIRFLTVLALSCGLSLARAEPLVLLTENLPPFNMSISGTNYARDDGVTGISSDILRAVCERAEMECQQILRFPWQRVYQQTLDDVGYGLFSTARTAEREGLFKWVGPIARNEWVLFAKGDSPIQLASIEDARRYRIGGYKGDAKTQFLLDRGLEVQTALRDTENVRKLERGQIDLWVTSNQAGRFVARQEGMENLRVVQHLHTAELYLALNLQTPDEVVQKLQAALDALRAEGALKNIEARY
ncbi:ABC transporter substrate-binding protein [Ectopseudomonas hydrolytica]|jgi:polar amino acid transport system substrate-binding protein|uniref:ABC transporter substrate-binding protein n=1 Tax=Ectopseudomonas hydrolytica TaxID=2493633 RepID=A0ABY5A971_9GAMM|nr:MULTISPECIES: ABC transporter substrate-binding protein [Pseudomonas]ATH80225.1 amino acid ABC transporter substrate-binding protein [Pseudomonas mendocina]EJO91956.1 amino acid ABC transporter periplasmic protein [Pseudomonas mendocina DLHK]MBA4242585.1 amino acid ABC transporter substrate-binding protein [Pseudomonas sp.]MDH0097925.1 ABC transporter substrate-binding protein [Pseudomonas sp. GD04158]USR39493.1 ABC transporter substrate-binding protein [Pseudomonas hydrolytica]